MANNGNLLIVGHNGYIGNWLTKNYKLGFKNLFLTSNINSYDDEELKKFLSASSLGSDKNNVINTIFFCAGGGVSSTQRGFQKCVDGNVLSTIGLCKKLSYLLKDPNSLQIVNFNSINSISSAKNETKDCYGATKEIGHTLFSIFCQENSIRYHNLLLPNIYGGTFNDRNILVSLVKNIVGKGKFVMNHPEKRLYLLHIKVLSELLFETVCNSYDVNQITLQRCFSIKLKNLLKLVTEFTNDLKCNNSPCVFTPSPQMLMLACEITFLIRYYSECKE